ncbi:DUF2218 domain-containing protein [Roseibium limicola]|uniref:DUF2218 domain-containing protein n=1 Tax=Roseibium limicola TaxID=2816037 RepID=A0A939EPJ6_9HYPH|nr:DUF2218 domain-containing protein [Roseibium limicola]MBO0345601.1 DUF2218 domain-containing protein [Roseibium limicola]
MYTVEATFKTAFASKYLQQLCKHFAHKVSVEFTPEKGEVQFPFGFCCIQANGDELSFAARTDELKKTEMVKGVIDSHLVKFAWREDVALDWHVTEIAADTAAS